jgi:catechol 2,3-dioxygenase-like lactoylglutathione lyase family enzyme
MIGQLRSIAFDVADVPSVARFYHSLTGWPVTDDDPEWTVLTLADGRRVCLQSAPDHIPPRWPDPDHPQQLHLDLLTEDIEAAADRAVSLGASRLGQIDTGGPKWITLADPAGHPFDLCQRDGVGDGVAAPMGLYGVCIDTEDTATLSRFYSELLGMPLSWEGDEGALLGGDDGAVYFQKVARHVRPQWPDPAHPQQGHLDVKVADIDTAEKAALAIGATRLPGEGDDWRVYADPAGHPFCLLFDV